jgi:tetratricopeptide (TPR) repeat protein
MSRTAGPVGTAAACRIGLLCGALALAGGSLAVAATPPAAVVAALREAETAYTQGDFAPALEGYRRVLATGWTSASLYYNLGCAAQKVGETGWAIAYFEDARRWAPHDPDIRHNLTLTLAQARERGAQESASPLLDAIAGLLDRFAPADAVTVLALALWIGASTLLGGWFLRDPARAWARRARPWVGGLGALAIALLLIKVYQIHSAPSGVIVEGQVGVRVGPSDSETVQFALHSGTFVRVGRHAGGWVEVALTPEMRGWVPQTAVQGLSAPRWSP